MNLFDRAVRLSLAAGLAAALLATPALPAAAADEPAASAAISRIRIDNFGQVGTTYFRGAQPEGRDYADLAALGVKTVIDLQADGEGGRAAAGGERRHAVPSHPDDHAHGADEPSRSRPFLQLVNDAPDQPVYVHCAGGRHRTGVMTAIYRMSGEGWPAEKAFQEMKQFKFGADMLHPEFKRFVYAFQPLRSQPAATTAIATVHQ